MQFSLVNLFDTSFPHSDGKSWQDFGNLQDFLQPHHSGDAPYSSVWVANILTAVRRARMHTEPQHEQIMQCGSPSILSFTYVLHIRVIYVCMCRHLPCEQDVCFQFLSSRTAKMLKDNLPTLWYCLCCNFVPRDVAKTPKRIKKYGIPRDMQKPKLQSFMILWYYCILYFAMIYILALETVFLSTAVWQ